MDKHGKELGKPKKLAMVAAMRKLLGAMMSVAKNRTAFVPKPLAI